MFEPDKIFLVCFTIFVLWVIVGATFVIVREPVLWAVNFFNPELVFKTRLSMAKRGYYKYDGLMGFAEMRGIPVARVLYPDNKKSAKMAMGNALDYKEMFGGKVIPA
jgi:hypothetical protein